MRLVSAHVIRSSTLGRATRSRLFLPLAALGLLPLACSRDADSATRAGGDVPGRGAAPYQVVNVDPGGVIRGSVELDGDAPRDTTVHPSSDEGVCGESFAMPLVEAKGRALSGAIVWLADARKGKSLPLERRYTLTNQRCLLAPRVQAVIAGGTLNVRSVDALVHRNRFLRDGVDTAVALVQLTDEGQVVPVEGIVSQPGRIEVRCDQHPWTHGWLLVFDHPYFTVTGPDGSFRIDSIPAGRYRLVVWHPRLGAVERQVQIEEGRAIEANLKLGR